MAQLQSEAAVIGSLLIDESCAVDVDRAGLSVDDFENDIYRLAFEVIDDFRKSKEPIDVVVVSEEMCNRKQGNYYDALSNAMVITVTATNVFLYSKQVKENAIRRKFLNTLETASNAAAYGDWRVEANTILEMLQQINTDERDLLPSSVIADQFLEYYKATKINPENAYCRTGLEDLDHQLGGGMFRSEVYIVGARPGMGKTTLGINIAQKIVDRGGAVLFVSLEMSAQQIQAKRISADTGIHYTRLMTGRINDEEEEQMLDWIDKNRNKPFYLTTKNITVGEIGRKARQIDNLACIIVDYIGLISCSEESRQKPRYEQMTEISAALKATAKFLNVPILALCQLNRENTTRSDKRPTMADLRDSGAIEQDAGAIILLHRPDYYTMKEDGVQQEMEEIELNVAKNRHAEPGMVKMWWHGNIGKIMMMAKENITIPVVADDPEDLPF